MKNELTEATGVSVTMCYKWLSLDRSFVGNDHQDGLQQPKLSTDVSTIASNNLPQGDISVSVEDPFDDLQVSDSVG